MSVTLFLTFSNFFIACLILTSDWTRTTCRRVAKNFFLVSCDLQFFWIVKAAVWRRLSNSANNET